MSFGQDEEELDWGDNVDVVSLGDEDEIPRVDRADENEVHEPASSYAPHHPSTPEGSSLAKTRSNSNHALGLSHLPPKPHTVVPGRRSRETIKAAAMSRSFLRERSPPPPPPPANEVPRNWETRRETQPASDRSNASSGRAAWPERPPTNRSARPASPPSRGASPPPRARSPADPTPRPTAESQPSVPARAMSPSSMLIPRRGQSPARGLAKNTNPQTYEPADGAYSNNEGRERRRTRNDRGRFSPGSPQVERARVHDDVPAGFVHNGRRRENVNGGMDHYSPPPEGEVERPRQGRSASPPRRTAMRSESMVLNQRARRSLSPRDHEGRFERPPLERMASESRVNRGYGRGRAVDDNAPTRGGRRFGEDMRREYTDMPDEPFRGRTNPMPPNSAEGVPLHRDSGPMPPNADDPRFHAAPFRAERFTRPDNRRQHSSRANQPRPEPPSVSPHDVPRREFMLPRDNAVHVRARNGDRIEPIQRRDVMPLEHEPMPMPAEEHDMRHDERIRQHRHRHTVSREEYVVMNGLPPQELLEGHMAQPGRNYPRPRDFPPHEGPEQQFGGDFRPREAGRFPNNAEQPSYPRPLAQESIAHDYESSPMPHGRHMPLHDVEPIPNRYPDTEQPPRDAYPRHYTRDDQFADRTSQTWERGVEVPTPPPEEGRHRNNRRHQSDGRRSQREAMSDTEYLQTRDGGRVRRSSRTGYDDLEVDARPRRHSIREAKQPFVPDDRQWTPRPPLPRMEIDVHEDVVPPNEVPPGWAEFHSRDRSPQVGQARAYRRPGAREVWPPADPDHDMGPEAEGGKRQKVEGGTKMTSTFSRDDEELPRKVPQHSPNLRPKPRSPVNSFTMVLQSVPATAPAPVDIQASLARAKNVASQLSAVNPATRTVVNPPPRTVNPPPRVSPTRTKSRFSQPVQATSGPPVAFNGPDSLSVNTRVGGHERGMPPGGHERNMPPSVHERGMPPGHERNMPPVHERNMPPGGHERNMPVHERNMPPVHERNMPPETNEGQPSRLEVPRDRRQGSEGSGDSSTPLVTRMGDASLGDERSGNPPGTGRPGRNTRWDSGKRDRNRNGDFRNGNNGNRGPRGDFWRPESDDGPRGSGMRAWDNPEPNMQRHEPNMQRHEPNMQRHEPNMQRHEPNMQRHEPNMQRDEPPHSSFAPNRSFVPRDSNFVPREARQGDSNFVPREARQPEPGFVPRDVRQGDSNFVPREARNRPFAPPEGNRPFAPPEGNRPPFAPPEGNRPFVPEGLPPRPPTPSEFSPPMSNSRGRNRAQSSPQRERFFVADADMVDAPPDPSSSSRPPQTLSFLSASNPQTPRKHSLLDRMTEPGTGERPLVARLSTGEQGINDGQLHRQNDGQVHRQQRRLKVNKPTRR